MGTDGEQKMSQYKLEWFCADTPDEIRPCPGRPLDNVLHSPDYLSTKIVIPREFDRVDHIFKFQE